MIELSDEGDDYVAYGSNNRECLRRVITQIANRSDSVMDMYLACAPHLCEFSGSIATRLFSADGVTIVTPWNGLYCAPSIDADLQFHLINSQSVETLAHLSLNLDGDSGTTSLRIVPERASAIRAQGVNETLWGIVAIAKKIHTAIAFFKLDGGVDASQDLAHIDVILAEFYQVACREHRASVHSHETKGDARALRPKVAANAAYDYAGKVRVKQGIVDTVCDLDDPRTEVLTNATALAVALHDIANFSNAIAASSEFITDTLEYSRSCGLAEQAMTVLENRDHIAAYISEDPQGKLMLPYIVEAAKSLQRELAVIRQSTRLISGCATDINEAVRVAQEQAFPATFSEKVDLGHLCDLAIKFNALTGSGISVERGYGHGAIIQTNKTKLMHVLSRILLNAQESIGERTRSDGIIRITIGEREEGRVRLTVSDNGVGIPLVNLLRIFEFGFTTKPDRQGYGLPSATALLADLGGDLEAHSGGPGLGAEFHITIPVIPDRVS